MYEDDTMDSIDSIRQLLTNEIGPEFIENLNNIQSILEKNELTSEDISLLNKWHTYYTKIITFKSQNQGTLPEDLAIQINYFISIWENIINYCYLDPQTKGKEELKKLMEEKLNDENLNSNNKNKAKSLTRMKDGINYYKEPDSNPIDYTRYGGFVSTILIVISIVILGIILAFINLFDIYCIICTTIS